MSQDEPLASPLQQIACEPPIIGPPGDPMLKSLLDMANEANQLCGVVPATHTERLEHLLRGKASIIAIEDEQLGNVLLG